MGEGVVHVGYLNALQVGRLPAVADLGEESRVIGVVRGAQYRLGDLLERDFDHGVELGVLVAAQELSLTFRVELVLGVDPLAHVVRAAHHGAGVAVALCETRTQM